MKKTNNIWNIKGLSKCKYRSGMPIHLFGDVDRDGVANVFDCRPRNPRRQDGGDNTTETKKLKEEFVELKDDMTTEAFVNGMKQNARVREEMDERIHKGKEESDKFMRDAGFKRTQGWHSRWVREQ